MFDRSLGNILGFLDGLLDGIDRFVEIGNYSLAHAARVGGSVAAIAQSVLVDFSDDDAGLGASNVNDRKQVFVLTSHFLSVLLGLLLGCNLVLWGRNGRRRFNCRVWRPSALLHARSRRFRIH